MSRTVLVTGAAKGIGRAIAARGQRSLVATADIRVRSQVHEMVSRVLRDWRVLDVLVNNAGILTEGLVEDLPEGSWDDVFDVNAKGTFLVSQAVIPHMKERHAGRIIHIASIGGKLGAPGQAHYCASRAAVIELARVMAMELGGYGFHVDAVCPGIILTEMGPTNLGSQAHIDKWTSATALNRLGEAEDVVGPVAFFASEDSAYITGQSLNVCGGINLLLIPTHARAVLAGRQRRCTRDRTRSVPDIRELPASLRCDGRARPGERIRAVGAGWIGGTG